MAYNSEYSGSKKGSSSNLHRDEDEESQNKINKTLKTLEFRNPGKQFSLELQGKRKPKSRNNYDSLTGERPVYDEKGLLISNGQDICDCLRENCPGCHFQCKQCKSTKCGNKCRVNRNWFYEKVEIEGLSNIKSLEMKINSN